MIKAAAREILGDVDHSASDEDGGKTPTKQVKAQVSDAGYLWTAANRDKEKAGIQSAKEKRTTKGGWTWFLPGAGP